MDDFVEESWSNEAEQAVLGGWMAPDKNDTAFLLSDDLLPEDFWLEDHQRIATCILELRKEGRRPDPITVAEQLKKHKVGGDTKDWLESVGGSAYLKRLAEIRGGSVLNAGYYADIIRECGRKRKVGEISVKARIASLNPAVTADACEEILAEGLAQRKKDRKDRTLMEVAASAVSRVTSDKEQVQKGWSRTYIGSIDSVLGAFQPQNVGILAGLPSTGKSSFAGFICMKNAVHGIPVGYISLEMTAEDVFNRMVACEAGIENQAIRDLTLNKEEQIQYIRVANDLANLPIVIIDGCEQTDEAVLSAIRRLVVRHHVRLVVIDYLQLIYSKKSGSTRNDELAKLTALLKATAKALDVYILEVSQFSRESAKESRKPRLQDLRDSGGLEQNADDVLLMSEAAENATPDVVHILVDLAKHRGGKKDTAVVTFNRRYQEWTT